jgi:hypothetical protein
MRTLESDLIKIEKDANEEIIYQPEYKENDLLKDQKVDSFIKKNLKNINIIKYINNLETQLQFIEKLRQL